MSDQSRLQRALRSGGLPMLAAAVASLRDAVVELNPGLLPHDDWAKALSRDLDEREERVHPIARAHPAPASPPIDDSAILSSLPAQLSDLMHERDTLRNEVNRLNAEAFELKRQLEDAESAVKNIVEKLWSPFQDAKTAAVIEAAREALAGYAEAASEEMAAGALLPLRRALAALSDP